MNVTIHHESHLSRVVLDEEARKALGKTHHWLLVRCGQALSEEVARQLEKEVKEALGIRNKSTNTNGT